ncbi:MAG: hypothetical protein ACLU4J_20765 [Butyricimonas paravirosa]
MRIFLTACHFLKLRVEEDDGKVENGKRRPGLLRVRVANSVSFDVDKVMADLKRSGE